MKSRRLTCRCCRARLGKGFRREGRIHGLCRNCWVRWRAAGFPEDGPSAPVRPWERVYAARFEDYQELRSWDVSVADAAVRVGVSVRTAERYETRLRQGAREEQYAA